LEGDANYELHPNAIGRARKKGIRVIVVASRNRGREKGKELMSLKLV